MQAVLSDIFGAAECAVLCEAALNLQFEDGRKTAGAAARRVKDNLQAAPGPETEAVLAKVRAGLTAHPLFAALAYPRGFARMIVSRTQGGGRYGDHVDNALMSGARSDLSFTLFLSEPDSYDGGELTISDRLEERQFKLSRGEALLYPSTTLHRVEPVTRGSRIVVVGWITSHVRHAEQREILFDLWQAMSQAQTRDDDAQYQLLARSRSNLLRMWAE
ncbi:Fe2+-dependent dioxygenase [Sedimentitalea sp. HM32M-2]|uniref:Fe2+-dependent dioxygenase n=1 Tax=Sedimentitalea sp. HM32M-2 TaxID=3351566 RepID=UPI0036297146